MKIYVKISVLSFAFWGLLVPAHAGDMVKGKAIFDRLCFHCHKPSYDEKFAPGLAGITERRDMKWLHSFLQNPSKMIKHDEYAQNLKESNTYNLTMPTLPEMQDEQAREDVIAYLGTLK
ncbi:c-type cytochrome [Ghiorsea bivora]|uniref:c-type cytochrome n=1 Tax=Ghiorsea bivora TaxID=1485545 RepID=UPI00069210CF|nr:cytochrome c [Ghiorsea bivora]